ncbi:MAG TPA: efflux RND transporter periplasmic adaptor subunit [Labilithrix sp.]|nr:efflux RND transporter periplasmic adaptor subunit [Labilithrix sp.]
MTRLVMPAGVRRLGLLLIFVPFVPLLGIACKKPDQAAPEANGKRGRGAGEGGIAFAVDLLQVEKKKVDYVVTAPGTIEAFERVQVTARVAGAVDRVALREGQDVKKGDTLVTIDSERFRLSVNSAKAQLDKAMAAQKDVEAQVARREGASEKNPGLIPGEELETFRTKVLTAKADTAVATEAVKIAELNLRDSAVRAPIDGTIQTRTVETGQYVQTGYVMATLLQIDPMLLRFQVEPAEAPRLKNGMLVNFTMRETQRAFTAKINLVAGSADATTHMVGITGQVDASEGKYWLRPGSFCDVAIDVGASRDAAVIPRTATRATDHGYVVYIAEGETAKEVPVTLGMNSKDGWVEIRSGLSGGEWLVVRGAEALTTGSKLRPTRLTTMDASAPRPEEQEGGTRGGGDAGDAGRRGGRREAGAGP